MKLNFEYALQQVEGKYIIGTTAEKHSYKFCRTDTTEHDNIVKANTVFYFTEKKPWKLGQKMMIEVSIDER